MVAEERWHGYLWSAVPHRVVSSTGSQLVTYLPTGAVSVLATNRDMPGTEDLTRDERKLLALKTCQARAVEHPEAPDKLSFYQPGRWSRTNLGWDAATGAFLGWYVNFELPPQPTAVGIVSKDLVLDLWVDADRTWRWKDEDDYLRALADGVLDPSIRPELDAEAVRVLEELATRTGPFAAAWTTFRPEPTWPIPCLPSDYGWKGGQWTLPPGERQRPP